MTKKDYELIAEAIARVAAMPTPERYGASYVALNLSRAFQADNPRFDRSRFLKACGIPN